MKKTLSLLAFIAIAGMASAPAQAATRYVSGFGGISWMQNMKLDNIYQAASFNRSIEYDLGSGVNLLGAIGCDYGSYRFEGEVGYQQNNLKSGVESVDGTLTPPYAMKGDVSVLSLMGNGYCDFDLGQKVEFYTTAGVGVAQISFHHENDVANPDPGYTGHETAFAWQVGAGFTAPIADHVKLDLRYRYFTTTEATFPDSGATAKALASMYNTSVSSHSGLLGLRADF